MTTATSTERSAARKEVPVMHRPWRFLIFGLVVILGLFLAWSIVEYMTRPAELTTEEASERARRAACDAVATELRRRHGDDDCDKYR
jgi:hypothetical protein